MFPRALIRLAVHSLVILSMVATTLAVPAQAASDGLRAAEATRMAAEAVRMAEADMPCGDEMGSRAASHPMPCDCCTPASCDLSACLGTACLPELPRIVAAIPLDAIPVPWNAPAPPSRSPDTPLRPPIA